MAARTWLRLALPAAGLFAALSASAQSDMCGELGNAYGPFDYRFVRDETLGRVDRAHFLPQTEMLVSGKLPKTPPGPDIDYTLRAFPNHHRALAATVRLGERAKKDPPPGMRYTVECWLIRAVRFKPDDTVARGLYAKFLLDHKRKPDAIGQLKIMESHAGDSGMAYYNLGLLYHSAGEYERALLNAHKATELGVPHQGLKDLLVKAGQWKDAAAAPAAAASAPGPLAAPSSPADGAASRPEGRP